MPLRIRMSALPAALLLLARTILCMMGVAGSSLQEAPRRIGAAEGLHCFCHETSQGRGTSISEPEAPAASTLYTATRLPLLDPGPGVSTPAGRAIRADRTPSREPEIPPPISLS